jgi:REP element-mobilizing transposase RayT
MSRPLRLEYEGAFWHVTSRGNERGDIFRSDADRLLFLSLLAITIKRFRWRLHEYTLMTNHYHLVLETPYRTLARGMHWLNSEYVRYFNKQYDRVGHLFQGRYKAILIDGQNYLDEVRRYTVLNPVRAGMVAHPAEYRWSSYKAHAGLEPIPEWLYSEWLFDLHPDRRKCHEMYAEYVAVKLGSTESIWDKLAGQIYLGSAEWIEKMRTLVALKPRSDEALDGAATDPAAQDGDGREGRCESVRDRGEGSAASTRRQSTNAGRVDRLERRAAPTPRDCCRAPPSELRLHLDSDPPS